jgi:hypothetical protein
MQLDSSSFVAVSEVVEALSDYAVAVDCSDDRTLFRQGESPVGLYVVRSGSITIAMDDVFGNLLLAKLWLHSYPRPPVKSSPALDVYYYSQIKERRRLSSQPPPATEVAAIRK